MAYPCRRIDAAKINEVIEGGTLFATPGKKYGAPPVPHGRPVFHLKSDKIPVGVPAFIVAAHIGTGADIRQVPDWYVARRDNHVELHRQHAILSERKILSCVPILNGEVELTS